jgi:hypothetical protein
VRKQGARLDIEDTLIPTYSDDFTHGASLVSRHQLNNTVLEYLDTLTVTDGDFNPKSGPPYNKMT